LSVEFAAAADGCAQLAQRLPGGDTIGQLDLVRRQAASIERAALANPPTQLARVNLDRLVPVSKLPAATVGSTAAAEAAAALVAAIYRADERGGITLRELRMVTAAAQISSEYIVAVATALPGGDQAQPWRAAGTAWHVARSATADFDDCRWTPPTEQSEVIDVEPNGLGARLTTAGRYDHAHLRELMRQSTGPGDLVENPHLFDWWSGRPLGRTTPAVDASTR